MKISVMYENIEPTTVSDHGIAIRYMYTGTEEEINKIKAYCEENIGTLLVLNPDIGEKMLEAIDNPRTVEPQRSQGEPVIKCQDCKYQVKVWREDKRMKEKGYWDYGCEHMGDIMGFWGFGGYDDEFCSDAEQKGDAE